MANLRYNWAPPVQSLLCKLQRQGVQPIAVNDGEEIHWLPACGQLKARKLAAEAVVAVDEACVCVQYIDGAGDKHRANLFIVLGNDANEILCDWGIPKNEDFAAIIEKVADEFYEQWEGKPVPVIKADQEVQA